MLERMPRVIDFDIRGQICPSSCLLALKKINSLKLELKNGDILLRIITDHRDATVTIPDSARNMGYDVKVAKESDYYLINITYNMVKFTL